MIEINNKQYGWVSFTKEAEKILKNKTNTTREQIEKLREKGYRVRILTNNNSYDIM